VRVFLAGNSGSGKTTLANRLYLEKAPRVLILDLTGEWRDRVDATVDSVADAAREVRARAASGRWRIALSLDPDDMEALVHWLVPVPRLQQSPIIAVKGAVLLVDEVDLLAPQGTASRPIRTLYRRSRHVGLSVISTTQRPANVSREVSAQSTHAIALALSEPRDRDYMAKLMRWGPRDLASLEAWTRRHPHGATWKDTSSPRGLWIQDSGKVSARGPASQGSVFDDDA